MDSDKRKGVFLFLAIVVCVTRVKTHFSKVAPGGPVLYGRDMDETLEAKLRELAEKNGIDPDELIRLAGHTALPDGLDQAVAAVLGDVALFGHALNKVKK